MRIYGKIQHYKNQFLQKYTIVVTIVSVMVATQAGVVEWRHFTGTRKSGRDVVDPESYVGQYKQDNSEERTGIRSMLFLETREVGRTLVVVLSST